VALAVLLNFQVTSLVKAAGLDRAFEGPRAHDGVDSFGADSIDLFQLGLTVTQQLSPAFSANGLPYQVTAYYTGTGWFEGARWDNLQKYSYFTPGTLWGPLGAG
jgi:hypothetical protein